jgi:flagellar FliJ protein
MTKFRLATLERLRTTALEQRGQELHAAALSLARGRTAHAAIAEALREGMAPAYAAPAALMRAAHYRERLRNELEHAAADILRLEGELAGARAAWLDARAQLKAVAVLHDRHRQAVRAEQVRREQAELDDLAGIKAALGSAAAAQGGRR